MRYLNKITGLILIALLLLSGEAGAEYLDRVAVRERQDGGVSITRFSAEDMVRYDHTDEDEFMAWYMNLRFPGEAFTVIEGDNIPKRPDGQWDKSQRGKWRFKNGKVQPDPAIELPEERRRRLINSAKAKLKAGQPLSDEEADELLG